MSTGCSTRSGAVGIDPKRVTIEITENALLSDLDAVGGRLERLREAGFKVALDDFGTGYASLAYLGSLPLDALKIDRGLIAKIGTSERDRIVVRSIFGLARELDLTVIVEGVESTAQLVLLAEWGCDLYQGFLGAGALDEMELARFVAVSQNERGLGRLQLLRPLRPPPRRAPVRVDSCSAPLSRASGVGQSRATTSLLSGRSFAAPFSRSI